MAPMVINRCAKDMDGAAMRVSDRVVCLMLPKKERCLSRILEVREDGTVLVDNGHIQRIVDPKSCILHMA